MSGTTIIAQISLSLSSIKYCIGDAKMVIRHSRVFLHGSSAFFRRGVVVVVVVGGDILEDFK